MTRTVLITGAARGLGRSIALKFASAGYNLALVDLNMSGLLQVVEHCQAAGVSAHAFQADVAVEHDVFSTLDRAREALGRINVLVNNAGLNVDIERGPFESISADAWDRAMSVNVKSAFLFAKAVSPGMREDQWGRVINMSSVGAYLGLEGYLHYITSKAALIGMTRALSRELGRDGITVNALAPGLVQTEVANPGQTPDRVARILARQAIPSPLTADDVAETAVFIASDSARLITGQTLLIDGGMAHT